MYIAVCMCVHTCVHACELVCGIISEGMEMFRVKTLITNHPKFFEKCLLAVTVE